MIIYKKCSNKYCEIKEEQPIENFCKNKLTKDGYHIWCNDCKKRSSKELRERNKERNKNNIDNKLISKLCINKNCKIKEEQPIDNFYNHRSNTDGKTNWCKECLKEQNLNNIDRNKKRSKDYCNKNKQNNESISSLILCKVCTNPDCKNFDIQPISNFSKNKSKKDGYMSWCKDCVQNHAKNNSENIKKQKAEAYLKNKDQISKKHAKYYEKNRENVLLNVRKYAELNKEKISQNSKEWSCRLSLFETFYERFDNIEDIRRDINNESLLQVKCLYCNQWFNPTNRQTQSRINGINGYSENNFYCSDNCKHSCPIYNQKKYPKGYKISSSREVQPELRKLVLERDNWACVKCNNTICDSELHCHHIESVNRNPIESADIDNCITLCKECHKLIHNTHGCKRHELKCS